MASSAMGSNSAYSCFCRPHTRKQTQKKRVHDLSHTVRRFTRSYLHAQTAVQNLTNHGYFDLGKETRIPPVGAPCRGKDCAGSGISGLYLWFQLTAKVHQGDRRRLREKPLILHKVASMEKDVNPDAKIIASLAADCRSWRKHVVACSAAK